MLWSAASKLVWRPTATTTTGMWVALLGMLVAGVVTLAASASPAQADTTFTVNSTSDSLEEANPGDGKCENGSIREQCTLRDAIWEANAFPGDDTIVIPAEMGPTIRLSTFVALPPLSITSDLKIDGPGAGTLAVNGNNVNRVFNVGSGAVVRIEGLAITGGKPPDGEDGGGILNEGTLTLTKSTVSDNRVSNMLSNSGDSPGEGGGIVNSSTATLTVTNSTISGNSAMRGGGIFNDDGTLTVTNSTISGNSASNSGAGIFNDGGTLTVTNSTISGNSASNSGVGGGIVNSGSPFNGSGTLTVTNSTISGNSASNSGVGGIYNSDFGTANLSNTILANSPSGENCSNRGTLNDQGYNIEDGTSCSFSEANNSMPSTEPLLGELANNGGPTQTHALDPRSPAINAIPSATNGCATTIATDQRRTKRPQGGKCEIGSFEDRSPWVKRVVPQEDATGISPRTKVSAFFSEEMRPRSITVKTFKLFEKGNTTLIKAQVEYDASTKRAILTPEEPLELGASYRVQVKTGVKDLAGNRLDQDKDPSNGNQQKKMRFFTVNN